MKKVVLLLIGILTFGWLSVCYPGGVNFGDGVSMGGVSVGMGYYGITWDSSTDTYTRTGLFENIAVGSSLGSQAFIQSQMKRCVLQDNGTVNYYLCATDSTKKADCSTASVLNGTDGQVMVEIPVFYYKYSVFGTKHRWDISFDAVPGFSKHPAFYKDGAWVKKRYIGAYESVLYDTSATRYTNGVYLSAANATFETDDDSITLVSPTNGFALLEVGDKITVSGTTSNNATLTVASIVSDAAITVSENLTDETDASFVLQTQKDWTATTGDKLGSVSGKGPINYGTRANFRAAALNRGTGWRQQDYDLVSAIQLLYLVEYASFYAQSTIGAGITNVADWSSYSDYNPIAATGNSNAIGNATGNNAGSASATTESTKYLSYRGIENWFGHLWKWVDGFNINNNIPYVTNVGTNFADNTTTNYTRLTDTTGADITLHNANGYTGDLEQTSRGFVPSALGGSASTKITDYYYQSTGWLVACLGGAADAGGYTGPFYWYLSNSSGVLSRSVSGRVSY